MSQNRTIGVLTSGGDAPGMNAAIRAVVRSGINRGYKVVGIKRGYSGLLENDMEELSLRSVSGILQKGGTVLYTSRCPEFKEEENQVKAAKICSDDGIGALVTFGRGRTSEGRSTFPGMGWNVSASPALSTTTSPPPNTP